MTAMLFSRSVTTASSLHGVSGLATMPPLPKSYGPGFSLAAFVSDSGPRSICGTLQAEKGHYQPCIAEVSSSRAL